MSAPGMRAFTRLSSNGATLCLRQQATRRTAKVTVCADLRQRRYQSGQSIFRGASLLWRTYPLSVSIAAATIIFGAGTFLYSNYIYFDYIIGAFHKYPEPVAKQLRKALYYSNISPSPKDAVKYYKEALRVANEVGMDPFSDEILGVKIQLAAFMESIQQYRRAIEVLEIVRNDCMKWVNEVGNTPGNEGNRTRILGKTVGISVKLGELYSGEYVLEKEAAEENLVSAVTTVLKEQRRREVEGVKPDEGQWLSPEEIGGSLEALAHLYEERNQHYLAAPLFLQAVALSPPSSCHTAVLMNNLSISLAQQDPPSTPGQPPISRPALVDNARQWARKALTISAKIEPPQRTEECDIGCAVATHNLGEFAEMDGDIAEARKRYLEAKGLSQALGFQDGVTNSESALKRIGNT